MDEHVCFMFRADVDLPGGVKKEVYKSSGSKGSLEDFDFQSRKAFEQGLERVLHVCKRNIQQRFEHTCVLPVEDGSHTCTVSAVPVDMKASGQ